MKTKKRKRSEKEAIDKIKKAKASKKSKKKKKYDSDDDDDDDDEYDDALAKDMYKKSRPAPGQFEHCEICSKRFTVYTVQQGRTRWRTTLHTMWQRACQGDEAGEEGFEQAGWKEETQARERQA